jgi:hypothetical protein
MPEVTFKVIEGIDKGRTYRALPTPVTIGREEGNVLRLNDERVSRFHAKIQSDNGEIIITDLDSTNGTRVNGTVVQIRRLRAGDRVGVGRSLLVYGSDEQIGARIAALGGQAAPSGSNPGDATLHAAQLDFPFDLDSLDIKPTDHITIRHGELFINARPLPPLPQKLTPSQAARLSEILDFLHQCLTQATEEIRANEEGTEVTLDFGSWQRVLAVQMMLARYGRAVADPEALLD